MLYAVIQRFDSLREIETSMTAEVRKLHHVRNCYCTKAQHPAGSNSPGGGSCFGLSIATATRPTKKSFLRTAGRNGTEEWIKQLRIIDSTTITLFSNAIFKGVGRHQDGKEERRHKGTPLSYTPTRGFPAMCSSLRRPNDSFMLAPSHYSHNEIVALDPRLYQLCQI